MKTFQLYLLAILSGLLLAFAWFPHCFTLLIFIAFLPLLMVEQAIYQNPQKYKAGTLFLCCFLSFLLWNIITTWWIKNASVSGAVMAMVCNSLLMAGTFQLFHNTKKRVGENWGYLVFICFWITFEYLHLDWDGTYPWLTLGHVFAGTVNWVQWYEYTGVFGGSLWVLVLNALLFNFADETFRMKKITAIVILIIAPIVLSYFILARTSETGKKNCRIVLVQPNIDPYTEKFSGNFLEQVNQMLALAKQKVDSTTEYLIFPETALTESIWENNLNQSQSLRLLQDFLKQYPKLKIIVGASTAKFYKTGEKLSPSAHKFTDSDDYYDAYNTAFQLDNSGKIQIYHKSKLVPGVERMPFQFIFKYFDKFAIDLGGTTGSLGTQDERSVFVSPDSCTKTAPIICYESIYGEFTGKYISNGAQFISIITNDGWWGNTPGYLQHLKYGTLRAVETRKWIARSANTGISCFINPKGEILQATSWWQPGVIAGNIQLNDTKTFYTNYGDYIARTALCISITLLIYSLLIGFKVLKK